MAKKSPVKRITKTTTRTFLFNTISQLIDRLDRVMSSANAENIEDEDLLFIAALLKPISLHAEVFAAQGKNKKKTPRVAARREG